MIVQNILPKLNYELQKNFVRVTFVDLRWGVASHESESCEAIQRTCLNEIERCDLVRQGLVILSCCG